MALIKHSLSLNALDAKEEEICRGDLDRRGDKLRDKAIGVQSCAVCRQLHFAELHFAMLHQSAWRKSPPKLEPILPNPTSPILDRVTFILWGLAA